MDNRTHILDCALRLFSARGYDAVGIQEVVDAAGVTKPTAYHYFINKRGLLDTLLERELAGLFRALRPAATYHGDLPLTLEKIVQVYFDFAREHPVFYRMLLTLYFASPDSEPSQAVIKFGLEQQAMLENVFIQAVKEHGNMRGRHRIYATSFLGMINTYLGMFLNGHVELNDALLRQVVHQFMHGIFS